jgi:hypothetical protein
MENYFPQTGKTGGISGTPKDSLDNEYWACLFRDANFAST